MCDIITYGTSLCSCGYGFKEKSTKYKDCRSKTCVRSPSHPLNCTGESHKQCTQPVYQKVMDIMHSMPCFECEEELLKEDGTNWEYLETIRDSGKRSKVISMA
ncbi:hypothetical protein M422DRAFT_28426 [Sphaerobolus stellatus SS14]|uniref:Uncharacterized protein n=1 Tax=Sphaerobolus stellatus (strain SS14) TaxID=990650 RepID=A0A0C9UK85_SPHS4|nr:hypothetical protein M422DRAFT_38461 [Sphaerobolus stellatus SS14]KIJ48445.1 hypothetical protein M422DRAFT_28426 [Sphaerobolus stellatus SS14]